MKDNHDLHDISQNSAILAMIHHDYHDMKTGDYIGLSINGYDLIAARASSGQIVAQTTNTTTLKPLAIFYATPRHAPHVIKGMISTIINAIDTEIIATFRPSNLE